MENYYVYLLRADDGSTYVGATKNLDRRIRQHNMEIKGGAKYTRMKVLDGMKWTIVCHVEGFPSWNTALQFEWRWKHMTRQIKSYITPYNRRIKALENILKLDRVTSNAIPFTEWTPNIIHHI